MERCRSPLSDPLLGSAPQMASKKRTGAELDSKRAAKRRADVTKGSAGEKLILALTALGLTQNESRAYLAILSTNDATASEAAANAGVPRPKIYEALANLESRGFCRSVGGQVRRYAAVDPESALRNWIRHREEERKILADRDAAHVELLVRLLPRPEQFPAVEIPDFMEAVSGRLPTTAVLEEVIASSRESLHEMLQPPFLQPRARWNTQEIEAIGRGVDVRVIYTPDGIEDAQRYLPLLEAGGQVRVIDRLPMKLLIKDDDEALISLRDANTGAQSVTTARVRHADLVAPMEALFKRVWRKAKPIPGATAAERKAASAGDRAE